VPAVVAPKSGRLLVDPEVSQSKFRREIDAYRRHEADYIARGWWLVRASYPSVFVVFGVAQLTPPGVRFGAILDFTNYDLWPPSVTLVDPFSQLPYKGSQLPTRLPRLTPQPQLPGVPQIPQDLVQVYDDEHVPFICLPGVREYHLHPAHTNDRWELRRGSGEGTLLWILEQLWQFGIRPVSDYQAQVQMNVKILGFMQAEVPA
jgi:Predicted metal binding domain